MDSEKRNPDQVQPPKQNELDLEFNQVEPITPKKPVEQKPSFLDKAKDLLGSLNKKGEGEEVQSNVRKEPVFGNANPSEGVSPQPQTEELAAGVQAADVAAQESVEPAPQASWKRPETWPFLQKLPQKHRRLVVALLAAILLLLFFLWLKPQSDTVDSFQAQNSNNLPIEFQPLDQQAAQAAQEAQAAQDTIPPVNGSVNENEAAQQHEALSGNSAQLANHIANNIFLPAPKEEPSAEQPVAQKSVEPKTVEKPRQPPQTVPEPRVEHSQTVSQPKSQQTAPQRVERQEKATTAKSTQTTKTERKSAPVVEAKPANSAASSGATSSKTLTVPQGVSLMQVFRDNQLNISDVNAMTKANGAGNTLSSFKPGDKVQVSLNSNGRVSEMRLQDGSRFIRQADGTYIYRK